MFKLDLEKAEKPEIKLPTSAGSSKKQESSRKTSALYAKAFDCVDHNKLCKVLKEVGIPDHLTCLLRYLYAGQEKTVRTGRGTTDWFQIGKGVYQGYILSPCYPTPILLPGKSHGWRSLVGCHLWGRTESDTTEAT